MGVLHNDRPFSERLTDYLQDVDYRVAIDKHEREEIFSLRYECYRREQTIAASPYRRFADDYDEMDNCWMFGIHMEDRLVSSIRLHVISPENPKGPALDVFPDKVAPMVQAGMILIDPTRLVVDKQASRDYPELPYVTIRTAVMAAEHFEADYMFATVREEHQAFYIRYFGCEKLCEPRPYPTLKKPISLLAGRAPALRDRLMRRFPVFVSSYTERRMLFADRWLPSGLAGGGGLSNVA